MLPIQPDLPAGSHLVIFAKDQPQFRPLPAVVSVAGTVVTEWEPTSDELERLLTGGRIRLTLIGAVRDKRPLTPLKLEVLAAPVLFEGEGQRNENAINNESDECP